MPPHCPELPGQDLFPAEREEVTGCSVVEADQGCEEARDEEQAGQVGEKDPGVIAQEAEHQVRSLFGGRVDHGGRSCPDRHGPGRDSVEQGDDGHRSVRCPGDSVLGVLAFLAVDRS